MISYWFSNQTNRGSDHDEEDTMSQKPTRSKYTTLVQICQLIPTFLVSKLARQYGVDQGARKFSAWSHVVSLLYAQLSHALSLNDVCDALNNHSGKLRTLRVARGRRKEIPYPMRIENEIPRWQSRCFGKRSNISVNNLQALVGGPTKGCPGVLSE